MTPAPNDTAVRVAREETLRARKSCRGAMRVVAGIALGVIAACTGEEPTTAPARNEVATASAAATVTLVTGDRVRVRRGRDGRSAVAVEPGPGREGVGFVQQGSWKDGVEEMRVIPRDALPLVASGR